MGGQNSQDSTLERRSLIWNDDGILDGAVPDAFYEAEVYKGKFFTRGCRGMLEQLQLYCIGDAVDEITLRYSPHPCAGPYGEVTIVPAAAWAWQDFPIEEMWNYDSLFIWVVECEANVDWAYDAVQPYDGHDGAPLGATWADLAIRPFIRAVYTGETPGDVPVSGTLNTIEVPAVGAQVAAAGGVAVADGALVNIVTFHGAGTMLRATWGGFPYTVPNHRVAYYELQIFTEEGLAYSVTNMDMTQSPIAVSGRNSEGELYTFTVGAVDYFIMNLRAPIKFRRLLTMRVVNLSGVNMTCEGYLYVNRQM